MKTTIAAPCYNRYRYPLEISSHTIRLYHRFSISFRNVEEVMAARGVVPSYETVRRWILEFGQQYANALREGSNAIIGRLLPFTLGVPSAAAAAAAVGG